MQDVWPQTRWTVHRGWLERAHKGTEEILSEVHGGRGCPFIEHLLCLVGARPMSTPSTPTLYEGFISTIYHKEKPPSSNRDRVHSRNSELGSSLAVDFGLCAWEVDIYIPFHVLVFNNAGCVVLMLIHQVLASESVLYFYF